MQLHDAVMAGCRGSGENHGEADQFRASRMPGRAVAGCARRLVVAVDHSRRVFRDSALRRIPEELGCAKNILAVRLRALVAQGILTTAPASDGSAYQEYLLTPKGRGVFPVLVALRQWSEEFACGRRPVLDAAGRSRQRPAGAQTRTARRGRPPARPRRDRVEAQSRHEAAAGVMEGRHCEERRDEAIHSFFTSRAWIASLRWQ